MTSFQIAITPSRRAAARHVMQVRRRLQQALIDSGMSQSEIARKIGVNRSVVHREIRGHKDITLGRVGELAWAMGFVPKMELVSSDRGGGGNWPVSLSVTKSTITSEQIEKESEDNSFIKVVK